MLNIELNSGALDDVLTEIKNDLESALNKNTSKKYKDKMICKTLGSIDTIWRMINIFEADNDIQTTT